MRVKEIQVIHRTDEGMPVLYVPLKHSSDYVVMEESAFNLLIEYGVVPIFRIHGDNHSVVCRSGGGYISVARLLLDCVANEHVRYLDGCINNLMKSNLVKCGGASKHIARNQITTEFEKQRYTLKHVYE
jgi:hypothetical protein